MKKTFITLALMAACSGAAMADGNAFTPLNFDDASYGGSGNVPAVSSSAQVGGEVPIGNTKMQSAILELDNAQIDVRNQLLDYKAKYSDIDAQFKMVKEQRKSLSNTVKTTEKRIKTLENTKEKIRKNMI